MLQFVPSGEREELPWSFRDGRNSHPNLAELDGDTEPRGIPVCTGGDARFRELRTDASGHIRP